MEPPDMQVSRVMKLCLFEREESIFAMWPFTERRRRKRKAVAWEASLYCTPVGVTERLQAQVIEISPNGARILLHRMHLRSYHLMVDNNPDELEMVIQMPEGEVRSNIILRWYNREEDEQLFTVGIEFCDMPEESKVLLQEKIKAL
ncbi:PilZ domain-containing protein [Desulfoferrobacter suflitae]|uniref:PilZ domain-containing protein n=1 Tax=Desulfoferrobacter suflitae TaxID=2865782 RepID=UPI002164BFFB|nr:PilZ domain-containing protein [Desulfoferrobacter suflitae]MCK8602768.1 PilZ domain-containing protein [Desulfoferrobacter suflitae]